MQTSCHACVYTLKQLFCIFNSLRADEMPAICYEVVSVVVLRLYNGYVWPIDITITLWKPPHHFLHVDRHVFAVFTDLAVFRKPHKPLTHREKPSLCWQHKSGRYFCSNCWLQASSIRSLCPASQSLDRGCSKRCSKVSSVSWSFVHNECVLILEQPHPTIY